MVVSCFMRRVIGRVIGIVESERIPKMRVIVLRSRPVITETINGAKNNHFGPIVAYNNRIYNHAHWRTQSRSYTNGSQYNYQYNQPYKQPSSFWSKLLFVTVGIAASTGFAYYMWWPKHTFPSSVAKILRKGLWAESDRGENDYQLALKYYLEALNHCNEIGLDRLSDEYTGIQLKVGEMFERLNMLEDAAFVYNEIATLYLTVLTSPPDSIEGKRIKNREHRRHLIQKDLRIAIKLVELNRTNGQLSKAILITHLIIAQDEVNKQLGGPNQLSKFTQPTLEHPDRQFSATLGQDTVVVTSNGKETVIRKTPETWEPFAEEFFNAMDLLGAYCISTGDLSMASKVKINMIESMLMADAEPHKILLSQCNLGSLLYLQAEEFESQEIALRRKFSEILDIEYDKIKSEGNLDEQGDSDQIRSDLANVIPASDKETYQTAITAKEFCIDLSIKSYEAVLDAVKGLPQETVKKNNAINEAIALATYGLGVVNLHLSQYEKAERLLRESRVRSKNCGYDDLITEIERELAKLFKEKKNSKSNKNQAGDVDISMDIHLKKV
ncbi:uncharacterized protein RJT20DRAFT_124081 [Scheffersomyces xylosifermentans]|uniref:uncharacterized protein n=1 Tax=Scheffersomyces xylosifermentans TaxID=1304137 RepID=UPI00315C84B0